jgi:NADH:ubiquinone oxidoreductase subunit F (NADH-binding)
VSRHAAPGVDEPVIAYAVVPAGYRTEVAVLSGPLLLRGVGGGRSLAAHRRLWPEPGRVSAERLISELRAARLLGRGGAEFLFADKLASALAAGRRRELVVNAAESEPASAKDSGLLLTVPHLVLDGARIVADVLGVRTVRIVVSGRRGAVAEAVRTAIAQLREPGGRGVPRFEVQTTTGGFVGGQSRAIVELLSGRPNLPVTAWQPESEAGLSGRPTLISNAETFAQLAALRALGPGRFARLGPASEPGTRLLSVAADGPGGVVLEVSHGEPLAAVLARCGYDAHVPLLLGGYHGSWLSPEQTSQRLVSADDLAPLGARLGAGVLLPLDRDECPVRFTAQVVAYLAGRRAGRCGPCAMGLPGLAEACLKLAAAEPSVGVAARIRQLAGLVTGRGACAHPDGTARLAASLLDAFPGEVAAHERGGCSVAAS